MAVQLGHGPLVRRPPASVVFFTLAWVVALIGFALLVLQMPQGTAPANAGTQQPVVDVSR